MRIKHKINHKHRSSRKNKMKITKMRKISNHKLKISKHRLKINKHNLKTSKEKMKINRLVKILKHNKMLIKMKIFELLFINDSYGYIN
jgi:hypothetical protein